MGDCFGEIKDKAGRHFDDRTHVAGLAKLGPEHVLQFLRELFKIEFFFGIRLGRRREHLGKLRGGFHRINARLRFALGGRRRLGLLCRFLRRPRRQHPSGFADLGGCGRFFELRQEIIGRDALLFGIEQSGAKGFHGGALRSVKLVVVIEALAQEVFHHDGPGHRGGEARRVISERRLDFGQHLRGAGGGVDPRHFGLDHGRGNFNAVDFPEHGLLVQLQFNKRFDLRRWHRLFKRGFGAGAVPVIDVLDGRAVSTKGGQLCTVTEKRQ